MTFIRIKSSHAVIRWLPLNFQTDEGTGYNKFSSGDLLYSSKFKNIKVEFQPLQALKNTKSQVNHVEYVLFASNDSEALDYAVECDPSLDDLNVVAFNLGEIKHSMMRDEQRQYQSYNLDVIFI